MGIYEELEVRRVLNANATLTRLGGSVLAPGVAEAMAEAGEAFVDLPELQRAVGREIARLTKNEACYVSCGAAAGLTQLTATCMTGLDSDLRARLPFTEGMKNEVIIHGHTRVGYDFALRMPGVRLIEIGGPAGTTAADLEAAITPRTAAMWYFPRGVLERGELPLETAIEVLRPRGIPVLVDAAAQLPLKSNLWTFTQRGADAIVFSGGKGLRGPQSTGLVLGRQDLVDGCAFHGPPNPFIGRGMKVGKEELCGCLAAVRWYLDFDEDAHLQFCEDVVAATVRLFAEHPHVRARRVFPSEAGQPLPRAELALDERALGRSIDDVLAALRAGDPCIDIADGPHATLLVNPQTVSEHEVEPLFRRLREVLA
jgi:L-seryl-tRNA(Ser) seleniumtransferase